MWVLGGAETQCLSVLPWCLTAMSDITGAWPWPDLVS
jgi:hypothetical protein